VSFLKETKGIDLAGLDVAAAAPRATSWR
jgi:hypothetical protein